MKIYLAGQRLWRFPAQVGELNLCTAPNLNVLASFYRKESVVMNLVPYFGSFMLDSGAFSFIQGGKHADWNDYVDRYIDCINRHGVKLFFELDIDKLTGYDRVKEIRRRIERETGKRPIPVWHKRLGREEFLRMCDEYDYVAIGGIVSKEIRPPEYQYFPWFIREAHRRGAKVHGLGFTNLDGLTKYHFDSVESTAWTSGNRFGHAYKFNGRTMEKFIPPDGRRMKQRETAINNFVEWAKFANWAEVHL